MAHILTTEHDIQLIVKALIAKYMAQIPYEYQPFEDALRVELKKLEVDEDE